jgi:hypothetical protein
MHTNGCPVDTTIEQIADRIVTSGRITRMDEVCLHQFTRSNTELNSTELALVRRLLDRLQMGLLKVEE